MLAELKHTHQGGETVPMGLNRRPLPVEGSSLGRVQWRRNRLLGNLYWVESDGVEDCFVVARNARSACRVEIDMNGFEPNEVRATQIIRVPDKVRLAYEKRKKHPWPWYVYGKVFFRGLGAQFRKVESKEEMLLEQVVYEIDDYIPCSMYRSRSIGAKALSEMDEIPEFAEIDHDEEDVWKGRQVHLIPAFRRTDRRWPIVGGRLR
jgi:hypothetical protein